MATSRGCLIEPGVVTPEAPQVALEVAAERGIATTPQVHVEQYQLDLALIEDSRRLDIEVDGEHYHRAWDNELARRDQLRNRRMIELGWDVMRFWVNQVRDDLEGCLDASRVGETRDVTTLQLHTLCFHLR